MNRWIGNGAWLGIAAVVLGTAVVDAQPPEMPKPTKEHQLLNQFAGEWEMTAETAPAPGEESVRAEGTESAKMVGGFWLVGDIESAMQGTKVNNILSIGYDTRAKKYVGTFLCSMDSTLWKYEGSMDESGRKLTLQTEGPSCLDPTKMAKYREVLELKDKDHKTFTSYMQADDGTWTKFVTMEYRRKK